MHRLQRTATVLVLAFVAALAAAASAAPTDKVWVTTSGKGTRYHRKNCSTLRRSHELVELTRAQAEKNGLIACKVCKP